MKFKCQKCEHEFTPREAKCENWRDESKSFICPNCDTSLAKPFNKRQELVNFAVTSFVTWFLFGLFGAIGKFGVNALGALLGVVSTIIVIAVAARFYQKPKYPLIAEPYDKKM